MELTFEQLPKAVATILESLQRIEKLLEQRSELAVESDKLMTVKEAAVFLNISVSAIYKLTMTMEIPCNKKSKRIYFMRSDLIEWVKTGRRKTMSEIRAEADKYMLRTRNSKRK